MPKRKAKTQTKAQTQLEKGKETMNKRRLNPCLSPFDRLSKCNSFVFSDENLSKTDTINTKFINFIDNVEVYLTEGLFLSSNTDPCKYKKDVKRAFYQIIKNLKEGTCIELNKNYFAVQSSPIKCKSERDPLKTYDIKFDLNGKLGCNCGIQFGQPIRGHCKHISSIIRKIIHNFYEKALMHGYCEHELTIIHNICYHYIQSCSSLKNKKTKKMKKVRFTLPNKSLPDEEKVNELVKMINSIM
tara:strand:- start:580 stop:1308 length:729 start_codon:yes stop_codon:yes gene_type:complete